ncbi:MAG: hypothetical protein IKU36_08030, partial [Bacteroidales bacterium]|nr:hypothetical protein [Bacteroidales bacterium]
ACQEKNITPDVPAQDQEVYTVQLGFGGEWDVTYEPLTRGNDNNDLYGIQVYSAPVDENSTSTSWSHYAFGLFDDVSNLSINLLKGFKFKFEATMVVDGKNKLPMMNYEFGYNDPFDVYGAPIANCQINKFQYTNASYFQHHKTGTTYIIDGYYSHSTTERYYGELVDYVPEESKNDKAKIHMKRTSFGAKFMAQGKLATAGQLEIRMTSAPIIVIDLTQEKQYDNIYTFQNLNDAYNYKNGNYEEKIDVSINWYYQTEDGSTVTVPLGTHKIAFKRNATTVVKVNLENTNVEGGVGFEFMEVGAMEAGPEYEINDGNNVDTELDTNK